MLIRKPSFTVGLLYLLLLMPCFPGCVRDKKGKKVIIAFSQNSGSALWRKAMLDWMTRELTFYPQAKFIYRDADGNSQLQVQQLKELIAQQPDVLLVSPNEPQPLTPVIEDAYKKGIPVIILERKTGSSLYTCYIGANNHQIGLLTGNYINNLLKGHGNVIEITGDPSSTPTGERHAGFMEAIKSSPGIKVIAEVRGSWLRDSAAVNLEKIKNRLKEVDVIFAHNDVMALGAHDVYKKTGLNRKIRFIGIDGLPGPEGGIQFVSDKIINATLLYPTGGSEAIQTAFSILNHEKVSKEYTLQTLVIDSSNVRLMKLQLDKINNQQSDIERRQKLIDRQMVISDNQKNIIYITSITLVLALIFGSIACYYLLENKKINKRLEGQNEAITMQYTQLVEQKNQLIEMTATAKEATEAKFNFFTNISHEFRTPLTLIIGPLEHLLESSKLHFTQKQYLEMVQKNTFRLLKLVNQLMDFRKLDHAKMNLQASENDLVPFVCEIVGSFQELARKKNILLLVQAKSQKINVWFDTNMLDKVLFNLLSNAFKFTPEKGMVTMSISRSDDNRYAVINVADNGIGMTPDTAAHVFDLFYQDDHSDNRGSGLGLNLSKELIGLHHGSITVNSEKNKGSNFEIRLPLGEEHLTSEEKIFATEKSAIPVYEDLKIYTSEFEETGLQHPGTFASISKEHSILIIEDNNDLRAFIRVQLEHDYEILESDTGDKGVATAFDTVPDLILCDIILPGKKGMEIVAALKTDARTGHIPIILLTAKGSIEEQIKGMKNKADAFIVKPFNMAYLKETIRSFLNNREILKSHFTSDIRMENKPVIYKKEDKKFVNEFVSIVESNIADENFSIDDICIKMGISRAQLYRKVKPLLGYNVNDYIMSARLQKAKFLLTSQNLTIAEIAFQVGFNSQAYFARLFKSKFGVTPTDYRDKTSSS